MRLVFLIIIFFTMSSCSNKYSNSYVSYDEFIEDVNYCLNQSCGNQVKSSYFNFSIISSVLAYGGGGGGNSLKNKISYKTLNSCLLERGYLKDVNGIFQLPVLSCK